jgi:hypothetical protein
MTTAITGPIYRQGSDLMSIDGVETFRRTMPDRTPEGYEATVIVLRLRDQLTEHLDAVR